MIYRTLGRTNLRVSAVSLGCEGFAGKSPEAVRADFDYAIARGINFLDLYSSDPQLRSAIGQALAGRREGFVIQGHLCTTWEEGQYLRTRDIARCEAGFEDLLARLGTSYVDIGMIHYVDSAADLHELLFRLRIENPDRQLLRDMAGVIFSSLLMLAAVAGALIYLLRTLFRQKTLEEMRLDLTHNITHELKTPIAVANAANDALLDFGVADDPARRERYLTVIREQLAALGAMVQRILTMSVEEREEFTLRRERFALGALLDETAAKFRMKARGRAEITVRVESADLAVTADRFHLGHVLDNLVDNALKYSGERVSVLLTARRTAKGVELRVADNGIGMDRTAQAHIFEKFYRVPTGDRHDVKGFGLGLYYVRLIVTRHGGTVSVESAPGRGSTFTLILPDEER